MKSKTAHTVSINEILRSYSGRRLQYAIKIGVLPKPESLKQFIKRKTNAANNINNTAMA